MSQYSEGQGVVYIIQNKINNKVYVGQTTQFKRRKRDHINYLKNNKHINSNLQRDFNKYGVDAFVIKIVQHCKNLQERLNWEKYYIDLNGGIESENTYNMTDKCSANDQVRLAISNSNVGKKHTLLSKRNMSNSKSIFYSTDAGKSCRQKISKSLKEYFDTDEGKLQREQLSLRARENYSGKNNPMYGKHHTETTKQKISETKKSKHLIPYNKGKQGLYTHSEETKKILKEKSTKYSDKDIDELRALYKQLGTYTKVAKVKGMNPNIVSRLIRFGTTACYK